MKNWRKSLCIAAVGTLLYLVSNPVHAAQLTYECDLSGNTNGGLSACPSALGGGANTAAQAVTGNTDDSTCSSTNNNFSSNACGARSDANTNAQAPIIKNGDCEWISNNSGSSIFIPFKSGSEWTAFLGHLPSGVTKTPCSLPGVPATLPVTPPYPSSSTVYVASPTVYGRADGSGTSVWPATPQLLNSGQFTTSGGSALTSYGGATSIEALLQWVAGSASNTHWTLNATYSPNLYLTALDTTAAGSTAGTSITATTGDQIVLTVVKDVPYGSASIKKLTTSSNWTLTGSSVTITAPATDTTYMLTSTDSNGLSSVATVTVTVKAASVPATTVGTCGADNGKALSTPPAATDLCGSSNTASGTTPSASGWSWSCSPSSGGTAQSCSASLQSAQCGTNVSIDGSGNVTAGTPCTYGTASSFDTSTGKYTCTTGAAAPATSVASCTATLSAPASYNTTLVYETNLNNSFTVPADVTSITVTVIGGGGGGGSGTPIAFSTYSGTPSNSLGAAGTVGHVTGPTTISVTPGQVIPMTIGAGGAGAKVNTGLAGGNGQTTYFGPTSNTILSAAGGTGGGAAPAGSGGSVCPSTTGFFVPSTTTVNGVAHSTGSGYTFGASGAGGNSYSLNNSPCTDQYKGLGSMGVTNSGIYSGACDNGSSNLCGGTYGYGMNGYSGAVIIKYNSAATPPTLVACPAVASWNTPGYWSNLAGYQTTVGAAGAAVPALVNLGDINMTASIGATIWSCGSLTGTDSLSINSPNGPNGG